MLDQDIFNTIATNLGFIILFVLFELYEARWQKADTFHKMIELNHKVYVKNPLQYFLLHTSFIYAIFLMQSTANYNFWMVSIVIMKFLDIAFKLYLIDKISKNSYNEATKLMPINVSMSPVMRYSNSFLYPLTFVFALF
jgi:hypothetical protein